MATRTTSIIPPTQHDDPRAEHRRIAEREAVIRRAGQAAVAASALPEFDPFDTYQTEDVTAHLARVAQVRGAGEAEAMRRLRAGASVEALTAELNRRATLVETRPSSAVFGKAPASAVPVTVSSITHPTPGQSTGGLPNVPSVLPGRRPMPNAEAAAEVGFGTPPAAKQASATPATGIGFGSAFHPGGHGQAPAANDDFAALHRAMSHRALGATNDAAKPITQAELDGALKHAAAGCARCDGFLAGLRRGASGVKARTAATAAQGGQHSPTPTPMRSQAGAVLRSGMPSVRRDPLMPSVTRRTSTLPSR